MTLASDTAQPGAAMALNDLATTLREREEELRTIVANTPVILWTVNADRVVERAVGGGLLAFDAGTEFRIGPASVDRRRQTPGAAEAVERAFAGETATIDITFRDHIYAATYTPVRDADGAVHHLIGTAWDVTEQRQAAAALAEANAELERRIEERTARWIRALEHLRKTEEQFRALAETSVDAVLRVDLDGRFIDVSRSFLALTGFSASEIKSMNVEDIVVEDDRAALRKRMEIYRVDDRPQRTRARIRRKDGGFYWSEGISCPVRDPITGAIREVQTIARDITEQIRAEEALRESEERYRRLAEESRDLIAVLDRDGNYVYASPSAEHLLGRSPDELMGRDAFDFVHDEDRERTLAYVREATRDRQPEIKATYRVVRPDGGAAWVESSIHPLRDETTGRVVRFHLVARDVTERVHAEESLRESEELFRLLAENSSTIVVRFGPDGLIRYASPSIYPVLGYAPEDAIGKPLSEYLLPEEPPWIDPATSRFASTGRRRALDAQGDIVWLDVSIRAVFEEGMPTPAEYHASARDVTARVEAEDALRSSEERYRHLAEDSTDIIAQFGPGAVWQYASPAVTRVLGYTSDELLGTSVYDILDEEDRERIRNLELGGDSTPVTILHRIRHKDGTPVWLETSIRPLSDSTGETAGYHVTSRDVSRRVRTEAALRESEERFRLLAEHSTDMIARHAPDGTYLYVSPAARRLLGYTPVEMVGRNAVEFIRREDYASIYHALTSTERASGLATYRARRKDGARVWLESSWHLIRDETTGAVVEWQSSTRDVSERMQAQELLAASEVRYRLLAEHSGDMFATFDGDGRFLYASPAAADLLGYTPEELIGLGFFSLVHPDDIAQSEVRMKAAREEGGVATLRIRAFRKDGGVIWTETVARSVMEPGRDQRIYSVTRDITQTVESEEALRESEELFRRIFDESPAPMALTDMQGLLVQVNDAYVRLLGYERHEIVGRSFLQFTHPDEMAAAEGSYRAIAAGQVTSVHRQKHYRTKDGSDLIGRLTAAPIRNPNGEVVAIVSIVEDITEQRRVGEELQRIVAMKSDFVTLVSHELRAPLTNMMGGLELIAHDTEHLPESAQRTLAILTDETYRLNRFVETILDVSRLNAGQLPMVLGPVAINVVIDRAMRVMTATEASLPIVNVAPELPLAWADELQLEHVLRNLIHNACHHSPPNQPIFIEARTGAHDIAIHVTDHGHGVRPTELPHLFEPFHRSSSAQARYKGYGLGLYYAKRLIEAQGGTIEVESPAPDGGGRGARFTVRVPLARQER